MAILACPLCDERPKFEQKGDYLICTSKGHVFPVIDGIPRLLPESVIPPEEAKELIK